MVERAEEGIRVEGMSVAFAKVMTTLTVAGVILMVVPAVAYFMGINQYVPIEEVSKYWNMTATEFWLQTTHQQITGHGWIFSHLDRMDPLSMVGVLILMITPLLSMLAGAVKAESKSYKLLLIAAATLFILAIFIKSLIAEVGIVQVLRR